MISISVVNTFMGDEGWTFLDGDQVVADTVNHASRLHQVYTLADPHYTGRVTVPMLWDKKPGSSSTTNPRKSSACSTAHSTA